MVKRNYEIILALLENFFIPLRIFSKPKMYALNYFAPLMSRVCLNNRNYDNDNDKLQCLKKRLISQKYKKMFFWKIRHVAIRSSFYTLDF